MVDNTFVCYRVCVDQGRRGFNGTLAEISFAASKRWEKKKSGEEQPSAMAYDNSGSARHEIGRGHSGYGIFGKCEICGKDFSPVISASENYLGDIVLDFYGKLRARRICKRCLKLMKKDSNCKIQIAR